MTEKILKATHIGELKIGDQTIPCAVLPDGTRVLSQRGVGRALGRGFGGKTWKIAQENGAGQLPFFLNASGLKAFIPEDLMALVNKPIPYKHGKGGGVALGIAATALPKICDVWLRAREAGVLSISQQNVAKKAEILVRGLANVGIIALVDEATGFQEVRDKLALQAILDKFLRKEFAAWAKRFPDEFYQEMFRLKGWQWRGMKVNRPSVVGHYTNDLVYQRLAPGILEELRRRNPREESGHRRTKHHQWLTEDVGNPALAQHLYATIGFMRAASTWDQFYRMMQRAFPKQNTTMLLNFPESEDATTEKGQTDGATA